MQTANFSGLHCEACVKLISKRLSQLPGVKNVHGDISGVFEIDSDKAISVAQITQIMTGSDYTLKVLK